MSEYTDENNSKKLNIFDFFNYEETTEIKIDENGQGVESSKSMFVPKDDISSMIDENVLDRVGEQVINDYNYDRLTMEDWEKDIKHSIDLVKQSHGPRNGIYQNMSDYKSSLLTQSALSFSDRVSTELLRPNELVNVGTVGKEDKDSDHPFSKKKIAERVEIALNYQINEDMSEWREEFEKLLYDLPYTGCCFKKVYFDPYMQRITSRLITYPNFAVNNKCHSQARLRRFSEPFEISKNELDSRVRQGLFRELDLFENDYDEGEAGYGDSDLSIEDNDCSDEFLEFIEQDTWYDLDDDGLEEPYTCIVHRNTKKVVRVFPRFRIDDVLVSTNQKPTGMKISDLMKIQKVEISPYEVEEEQVDIRKIAKNDIVRIKPIESLIKYGFIKDPKGGFLDVGFSHLLSAHIQGVNATSNMLLDAGKVSNMVGGILSKEFRTKKGPMDIQPGEFAQTDVPAALLQSGFLPFNFKEPSQVLYQLNADMKNEIKDISSSTDLSGILGANTPATTALAYIEEQQQANSAIILRLYRAMSKEFKLIYELDGIYLDQVMYEEIIDSQEALFSIDFNSKGMDITPSANPDVSSKIQRLMKANAEIMQIPNIMQAGGDIRPILRNYLELLDVEDIEEILPELTPVEEVQRMAQQYPEVMEFLTSQQAATQQVMDQQIAEIQQQSERENMRVAMELDKAEAEIKKKNAETLLNLEKAESEEVKNQIDIYTAQQNSINNTNNQK